MVRKKFNSNLVFGKRFLKTKIKFCDNKITTNFNGKTPKDRFESVCLSAIVIYSVFRLGKVIISRHFSENVNTK